MAATAAIIQQITATIPFFVFIGAPPGKISVNFTFFIIKYFKMLVKCAKKEGISKTNAGMKNPKNQEN